MTSILGKVVENARILGEVILVHEEPFAFPSDEAKYALPINIKEFLGNPSLVEYFFEDKQHAKYALRKSPDAFVATVFIVESQQYGQACQYVHTGAMFEHSEKAVSTVNAEIIIPFEYYDLQFRCQLTQ